MLLISFVGVCLFTSLISVVFGIFVFRRGTSIVNKIWLLMSLSIALWSFGLGMMVDSSSQAKAIFFLKNFHYVGATLIPAFYLHFVLALLGVDKKHKYLIGANYIFSSFMLFCNFQGTLASVRPDVLVFKYFTKAEIFYIPYTVVFFASVIYTLYAILKVYIKSYGRRKNQLRYQLFATIIGFGGGGTAFLTVFFPLIFPFGMYLMFSYVVIMSYAITKYRLMDIKVVAVRTLIFSFVYVPILMVPFFVGYKLEYGMGRMWMLPTVMATLLAPSGLFLFLHIQKRAEERVKAKKIKYLNAINEFLEVVKRIRTVEELMDLILKETTKLIGVDYASFYLVDKESGNYALKKAIKTKYFKDKEIDNIVKKSDVLMEYLRSAGVPIIKEELKYNVPDPEFLEEIENEMSGINASLIIPSFSQDEIVSFIVLGERKRQEPYADEDIKAFNSLGINVGLAVRNALFVDELHNTQADLIIAEKFAAIGRLAESAKHEISNPLHGMYGSFQQVLEMINDKKDNYNSLRKRAGVLIANTNNTVGELVELVGTGGKEGLLELKEDLSVVDEALESLNKISETEKLFGDNLTGYEMRIKDVESRFERLGATSENKEIKEKIDYILQLLNTVTRMVIGKVRDRESALEKDINSAFDNAQRIDRVVKAMYGLPRGIKEGEGVDVKYLIEKSFELTKHQTYWENLGSTTTEVDIPEDLPKIAGSAERLEIVFLNIVTNAYQAMTDAGIKDMKDRIIKIKARVLPDDPDLIEVCLANSGPAIEEDNVERIFTQEFTTKDEGKHRGLGLYIAKIQIEVFSKGKIMVRNIERFGPEFVITLPVWKEKKV